MTITGRSTVFPASDTSIITSFWVTSNCLETTGQLKLTGSSWPCTNSGCTNSCDVALTEFGFLSTVALFFRDLVAEPCENDCFGSGGLAMTTFCLSSGFMTPQTGEATVADTLSELAGDEPDSLCRVCVRATPQVNRTRMKTRATFTYQ